MRIGWRQRRFIEANKKGSLMPNPNEAIVTVDSSGNVHCTPDPLPARGSNVHLKFVLQTDGYTFRDDNAVVVTDPGSQFPESSKTQPDKTVAKLLDRNNERGSFKYTLYLKTPDGQPLEYDPTIQNEL
jgi:hypothetical protein